MLHGLNWLSMGYSEKKFINNHEDWNFVKCVKCILQLKDYTYYQLPNKNISMRLIMSCIRRATYIN
jgi:hypothetical protein